nr:MAG TPA: hypothetical protein [Caudoviricetes sp.]
MSELIVKFGACFKNEQEMTADMTILEAIGIGVGAVATVLAGVWFIVNKAFGVGRFSHRMEEVDKRTSHAACDMHERAIGDIKDDIRIVKADVESIKSLLVMKHKEAASVFSIKHSPRQLNEAGRRLFAEIGGRRFLEEHRAFLFSAIEGYAPKTALDVENAAHGACLACADKDIFNGFKDFIYNSPSYIIKDANGEERRYDLSIPDICFVLSLPLRDMYLKAHPEIAPSA